MGIVFTRIKVLWHSEGFVGYFHVDSTVKSDVSDALMFV